MIPAALRPYPDYLRLWVARVATVAAGQMMMVAVGWELYDLRDPPGTSGWWGCCSSCHLCY